MIRSQKYRNAYTPSIINAYSVWAKETSSAGGHEKYDQTLNCPKNESRLKPFI